MKPQNTILTDFQWLMLDDRFQNEVPQELYTEPLSLHYSAVHQPETSSARFHHRSA